MGNFRAISDVLERQIAADFWPGYVHCYPHKKAYRPLNGLSMSDIWREPVSDLNLYVHIPFCDRKCAFCNLLSMVAGSKREHYISRYVQALVQEIKFYADYVGSPVIRSLYYGGGTPNVLSLGDLERIQDALRATFPTWSSDVESCIECSPDRLDESYIRGLKRLGFARVSVGVQTFFQTELDLIGRRYDVTAVDDVVRWIRDSDLNLNIDLIYGLPKQTYETLMVSLGKAVEMSPESITIYPLAVRRLTGIEHVAPTDLMSMQEKYHYYDDIRDLLERSGYRCQTIVRYVKDQESTYQQQRLEFVGVPTLGLGAGARSYSPSVHYSLPYKIQQRHVEPFISRYMEADFAGMPFDGFIFDEQEQKRKFIILFLLDPMLSRKQYESTFNERVEECFGDEFRALLATDLVAQTEDECYVLTRKGRKYCDIVGQLFESSRVKNLCSTFEME